MSVTVPWSDEEPAVLHMNLDVEMTRGQGYSLAMLLKELGFIAEFDEIMATLKAIRVWRQNDGRN